MSRYYIWKCKLRDEIPNLPQFFCLLKKTYEIETNELNLQPEKWKLLLGHLKFAKLKLNLRDLISDITDISALINI